MSSCNGVPINCEINPIKIAGCTFKRSCNASPAKELSTGEFSVVFSDKTACNAWVPGDVFRRQ